MISGTEYVVIAFVLFLVFGPERLPEVARKLGGWLRDMRRAASDIRIVLEAEAGEMTEPLREVSREARRLRDEGKAAFDWKGPVHPQGPGPADSLEDLADIEGDVEPRNDASAGASQVDAAAGAAQDDVAAGAAQVDASAGAAQNDVAAGAAQDDASAGAAQDDASAGAAQDEADPDEEGDEARGEG